MWNCVKSHWDAVGSESQNKLTKNKANPNGTPMCDKLCFGKFCCLKDKETHCGRNCQNISKVALNLTTKNNQIILGRQWFTTPMYSRYQMNLNTRQAAFTFSWGAVSYTKSSMTFVNIPVAISALAEGGALSRFRTESKSWWCFRDFSTVFGCLSFRTHGNGILNHFGKMLI